LLTTAAQTDIGLVRNENEDRFLCEPELHLFAVADGIGGLPDGSKIVGLEQADGVEERRKVGEATMR
jgi:serine/threonine protein phosphatase PrpC